jgi:sortase (surface protein transpeptidase)
MTGPTGPATGPTGTRSLPRGSLWILGGVLLVVGVVLVSFGFSGSSHPLAAPKPSPAAVKAAAKPTPVSDALSTTRSLPMTLRIPALGMSVPLLSLGLNADGTVQVPTVTTQPGWFRLGVTPGQIGSAVILGHVDSYRGVGIFFELRTLAAGDQVDVGLTDGVTAQFTVDSVAMYSKLSFPAQRVYGSHGSSALHLVTCGGVFDHQTGSYLSNIVVYTSLTAVIPAPLPPT